MRRFSLKAGATARARLLRRTATPEERTLWQTLRRQFAGARFRRQVPLGSYFVDFVSHGAKLVIELDGSQHAEQQSYDAERTRFLESEGYGVIRFWNREVAENLDGVFRAIEAALDESTSPLVGEGAAERRMRGEEEQPLTPSPSPLVGEGAAERRMRGKQEQPLTPPSPTRGEGEQVNLSVGVS